MQAVHQQELVRRTHGRELPLWMAALIGGSRWTTHRIPFNAAGVAAYLELASRFWNEHVLPGLPPAAELNERGAAALDRLYPRDTGEERSATDEEYQLAVRLRRAMAAADAANAELTACEVALKEHVAQDTKLLFAGGGYVSWKTQRGAPAYKAIAQELAGGPIREDVLERHRTEPQRVFRKDQLKKLRMPEELGLPEAV
jgi:hypothetical protein